MSFIDTYIKDHRTDITKSVKKGLTKLENKLSVVTKKSKGGLSFLDAVKDQGERVTDLIERVRLHFDGWEFGWLKIPATFQFVTSIATEVYQIVDEMHDNIVPDGASDEEAAAAKRQFGMGLTYFVWKTIGPLDKKLNWVPFKKTIEKKIVFWLAGMGLDAARRLFNANKEIGAFSVKGKKKKKAAFVKAL